MKKLPEQVKICGFNYTVQYDETLAERGLLGEIQLLHGRIHIRPGMSKDIEEIVLWHEMGHGWLFHNGIHEHDEKHLDLLSTGGVVMRRDNPELLK